MGTSREFREGLRRELPTWQADGVVTPGAARALQVRYDLDASAAPAGRDRAGPLSFSAGLAVALALAGALLATGLGDGALLPLVALAAAFAAAPLAARGEGLLPAVAALRVLGRGLFYVTAFSLSFAPVADAMRLRSGSTSPGLLAAVPVFLLAAAALAAGMRRADVDPHARGEALLLGATVIAFAAGLSLPTGEGAAIVANLALAFLAAGRIVRGVSWLARAPFFEGLFVAACLGGARLLDVARGPWTRAAGGAVLAAFVFAASLAFERRRSRAPRPVSLHVA